MKLLQITGSSGGDTLLMTVPDDYQGIDIADRIEEMEQQGLCQLYGLAETEAEIQLSESLKADHYSVFVLIA